MQGVKIRNVGGRSVDNSFSGVQELQKFRSSDNSFDYEKQKESASSAQSAPKKLEDENKESASSAQSAPKKSCGLCHPEDTEGPVNVSCRGGVCPPEYTKQTHSLGQADPAPTVGGSKDPRHPRNPRLKNNIDIPNSSLNIPIKYKQKYNPRHPRLKNKFIASKKSTNSR